ncbi:jg14604 [Pararge aegeria aegeria]|uniref:Jg14604 protein n=1 Tax=Pararge aegeria aegeria TaxID=348720 RepID=A0A8S4R0B4_9NEOP|nr:jg14604 [Pararge aegeria aegeria]
MSTKRQIFNDVSFINKVKTGSDHRMVRGTLNITVKLGRVRLKKSMLPPTCAHIQNPESFQNRFDCLDCDSVEVLNNRLVNKKYHRAD